MRHIRPADSEADAYRAGVTFYELAPGDWHETVAYLEARDRDQGRGVDLDQQRRLYRAAIDHYGLNPVYFEHMTRPARDVTSEGVETS